MKLYNSDPLNADTDNDGLNDGAEIEAGTDLLDADTDDDGVSDGIEVNEMKTNPLNPEFDGTVIDHLVVPGAATNSVTGDWEAEGTELRSKDRRGELEYIVDLPQQDLYCLNISATHLWEKSGCTPVTPIDTSYLQVTVDGLYVGSYPLVAADSVYKDIRVFLPVLPAGEHTVRIFWENTHKMLALKVRELRLQEFGGPDADADGVKDWIQASLNAVTGIDSALQSVVSPICLEGEARYVPFMSITGGSLASATADGEASVPPHQSAGDRWYANVPLNEDGLTDVDVSFQNDALVRTVQAEWTPYNIISHHGAELVIRKGDALRLTCIDPARATEDFEKARGGQFSFSIASDSMPQAPCATLSSPNTRPLVYSFPEAGSFNVSGTYTHGNDTQTASVQVRVIDWAFPQETPACLIGREREWIFSGVPENISFETDETVSLDIVSSTPITNNLSQITCSLTANAVNGDHAMVARVCPGGAIMDSAKLNPFWVQNATEGYFWVVERYEDSELWEINSIVKNLPESVDMQIKVIIGGVTLDDYTLERWLTNADYDETGQYHFRLFHPDGESSACHTFKLYQAGMFIGEAFWGWQDSIESK